MLRISQDDGKTQLGIQVMDGIYSRSSRENPIMYLTSFSVGSHSLTLSWRITENTAKQLRVLADQAEKAWEDWENFQSRPQVCATCGTRLVREMEIDCGTCVDCQLRVGMEQMKEIDEMLS